MQSCNILVFCFLAIYPDLACCHWSASFMWSYSVLVFSMSWRWKPSGNCKPGVRSIFPPLIGSHLKGSRFRWVSICCSLSQSVLSRYRSMLLPVLCNKAMEKHSHLHFSEVCSDTKSHATTKCHEILRGSIYFCSLQLRSRRIFWASK